MTDLVIADSLIVVSSVYGSEVSNTLEEDSVVITGAVEESSILGSVVYNSLIV